MSDNEKPPSMKACPTCGRSERWGLCTRCEEVLDASLTRPGPVTRERRDGDAPEMADRPKGRLGGGL